MLWKKMMRKAGIVSVMVVAMAALVITGCAEDEAVPTNALAATAGVDAGFEPPSMDELQARLGLSDEQATELAALMETWKGEHQARAEERRGRRGGNGSGTGQGQRGGQGGGGQGSRGGGEGQRGGNRPGGGQGDCEGGGARGPGFALRHAGPVPGEHSGSPMINFMEGAAGILTDTQMVGLAEYLGEGMDTRREAMRARFEENGGRKGRAGRGGGQGDGQRGGPGGKCGDEFGLDETQKAALREAHQTQRATMRGLFMDYRDGSLGMEELRTQGKEAAAEFKATIAGVLTEDQLAQLEQKQAGMHQKHVAKAQTMVGQGIERRVEFMTNVLHLEGGQPAQVQGVMEGGAEDFKALYTSFANGETDRIDMMVDGIQLRQDVGEAVRGQLQGSQVEVWDAVHAILPGPRGRRGH